MSLSSMFSCAAGAIATGIYLYQYQDGRDEESNTLYEAVVQPLAVGAATYLFSKAAISAYNWGGREIIQWPGRVLEMRRAIERLNQAGILTQENRDFLAAHPDHAELMSRAIIDLHETNSLTPENRDLLALNPEHALMMAMAIWHLDSLGILQENRDFLAAHPDHAEEMSGAIIDLHGANSLTPENRDLLALNPEHALMMALAIRRLDPLGILQENRDFLAANPEKAYETARNIHHLYDAGILQEYRYLLAAHPEKAYRTGNAIMRLHQAGILQESRNLLAAHPELVDGMIWAIVSLHRAGIFQENRPFLAAHPELASAMSRAMVHLHQSGILNRENRNALLEGHGQRILDIAARLEEMPLLLTREQFDGIIREVEKTEWEECEKKVRVVSYWNGQIPQNHLRDPKSKIGDLRLPPEIVADIGTLGVPPSRGISPNDHWHRATALAEEEEKKVLSALNEPERILYGW